MRLRPPTPRRSSLPGAVLAVLAACCIALVAGCGADDEPGPVPDPGTPGTTDRREPDGRSTDDDEAEAEEEALTREAVAAGRRFDALTTQYAPVSARVNYLVAAETLRADAIAAGSATDPDVERARAGVVRVEARRMIEVLEAARPEVAAVAVASDAQREVQSLMLAAIDARRRASVQLLQLLAAAADEGVGDSDLEALEEAWTGSWDESVREAREATSTLQEARGELGLDPSLEEAIR